MKITLKNKINVNEYRAVEYYDIDVDGQTATVYLSNMSYEELDWHYPHLLQDGKPVCADELIETYEYDDIEEFIKAGWFDRLERKVLQMAR